MVNSKARLLKAFYEKGGDFEIIINQMRNELHDYVRKATEQLEKDKQRLTNEQARTEAIISNLADGAIVVDDQGRIITMNPAAERAYGYGRSELLRIKIDAP